MLRCFFLLSFGFWFLVLFVSLAKGLVGRVQQLGKCGVGEGDLTSEIPI